MKELSIDSIDLVMTISCSHFENSNTISTGLPNFQNTVYNLFKDLHQRTLFIETTKNVDRITIKRELDEKLNQQINRASIFRTIA